MQQLGPTFCGGDRSLWAQQSLISCHFDSLSLILAISFSCDQTLGRGSLKQTGLPQLLFQLSPYVGWIKQSGCVVEKSLSKSAALNPKHPRSSPMMMMTTVYVLCMTLKNVPLVWRRYLGLYSKESMKSEMVPVNVPDKKCDCYQCFKVDVPKAVSKGKFVRRVFCGQLLLRLSGQSKLSCTVQPLNLRTMRWWSFSSRDSNCGWGSPKLKRLVVH